MLCNAMLCYAMLCYVMLCYAIVLELLLENLNSLLILWKYKEQKFIDLLIHSLRKIKKERKNERKKENHKNNHK